MVYIYPKTTIVYADKFPAGGSAQEYLVGGLEGCTESNLAPTCRNSILIFCLN
jgi:hypothetical protein